MEPMMAPLLWLMIGFGLSGLAVPAPTIILDPARGELHQGLIWSLKGIKRERGLGVSLEGGAVWRASEGVAGLGRLQAFQRIGEMPLFVEGGVFVSSGMSTRRLELGPLVGIKALLPLFNEDMGLTTTLSTSLDVVHQRPYIEASVGTHIPVNALF